jgi:hypothetical protein
MGRTVLSHDADGRFRGGTSHGVDDAAAVGQIVGHHQVPNQHAPHRHALPVGSQRTHLPIHLRQRRLGRMKLSDLA